MIPNVPIPTPGKGPWQSFAWSGDVGPGDSFQPIKVGDRPARVSLHMEGAPGVAPRDGSLTFEVSADGRRGWRTLEDGVGRPVTLRRQGDHAEFRGVRGWLRPKLNSKTAGTISLRALVDAEQARHQMHGAVA